ncbi:response regulator transcription factor [Paenibacillus mangrovi]
MKSGDYMHEKLLVIGSFLQNEELFDVLQKEGYVINMVLTEREAMRVINEEAIDMLMMDRAERTGITLHKIIKALLREQGDRPFPIILFEEQLDTEAVIDGLDAGANDVVAKEIRGIELVARIQNLLRIFHIENERGNQKVVVEDLVIDPAKRKVRRGDKQIPLTVKEFDLLLFLARHVNQVCTREEILKKVWDYDFHIGTNVVDVYIRHLRTKMDKGFGKKLIQSVRGVGYVIKEGE